MGSKANPYLFYLVGSLVGQCLMFGTAFAEKAELQKVVVGDPQNLPDRELLEFLADFGDTDDETFELILFHGKQDHEQGKAQHNGMESNKKAEAGYELEAQAAQDAEGVNDDK